MTLQTKTRLFIHNSVYHFIGGVMWIFGRDSVEPSVTKSIWGSVMNPVFESVNSVEFSIRNKLEQYEFTN